MGEGLLFIFNGKKFISARQAARLTGYASDYVGQLCRAGKVDSKMVGRSWYVSEESILLYQKVNDAPDISKIVDIVTNGTEHKFGQSDRIDSVVVSESSVVPDERPIAPVYVPDAKPLLPRVAGGKTKRPAKKISTRKDSNKNIPTPAAVKVKKTERSFPLQFPKISPRPYPNLSSRGLFTELGKKLGIFTVSAALVAVAYFGAQSPYPERAYQHVSRDLETFSAAASNAEVSASAVAVYADIGARTVAGAFRNTITALPNRLTDLAISSRDSADLFSASPKEFAAYVGVGITSRAGSAGAAASSLAAAFYANGYPLIARAGNVFGATTAAVGSTLSDSFVGVFYQNPLNSLAAAEQNLSDVSDRFVAAAGVSGNTIQALAMGVNRAVNSLFLQTGTYLASIFSPHSATNGSSAKVAENGGAGLTAPAPGAVNPASSFAAASSTSGTLANRAEPPAVSRTVVIESPRTVVEKLTERTVVGDITRAEVDAKLAALDNALLAEIHSVSGATGAAATYINNVYNNVAAPANRINNLSNVTIESPSVTGGTFTTPAISGGSIDGASITNSSFSGSSGTFTGALADSGAATSTFSGGVYASLFSSPYFNATSSTATSSFAGNIFLGGSLGIGTTSPWAALSINPDNLSGPSFAVGSSAATNFIVLKNGNVGIGTTSPSQALSVFGNGYFTGDITSANISAAGTVTVVGLANLGNLLVNGSSTLQNLTFVNATGTAATTTDLFSNYLSSNNLNGANGTITNLNGTNATITNATTTGLFATIFNAVSSVFSSLTGGSATVGSLTATSSATLSYTGGNMLITTDANGKLVSSSTPTAAYYLATSTTATSSFAGNIFVQGGLGVGVATSSPGVLQTSSDAWIGGNLHVAGNSTTIGNSTANTLTINSSINSDLVPDLNNTRSLGSPSYFWKNVYVDTLTANNISAASTTIGGTASKTFTIDSANSTADTENQSIIFDRGTVVPNAVIAWDSTSKDFNFNQPIFAQNKSSDLTIPSLQVLGATGQSADILQIASSTGGLYFNVANGGNVGIGTTTPGTIFSINQVGNFAPSGSTLYSAIALPNVTATSTTLVSSFQQLLANSSTTLQNFTFANATGTSATTTNLFASIFNATTGAITNG
ncbi:hypothetical protein KGQ31_02570, partial [Patescibacteria group bacterium]|nr:hypothetical protein [Patescibacteria group bacterium]